MKATKPVVVIHRVVKEQKEENIYAPADHKVKPIKLIRIPAYQGDTLHK